MDYKRIIKSRDVRLKILKLFDVFPDKAAVIIQYWIKTGRKLNLKMPQRYSEKLQWYKLYYRDPLMRKCADKYLVREYVTECGYEGILNPIIGVYDGVDEIKFNALPEQFVIKDTLGWGGTTVLIVRDKTKCDYDEIKKVVSKWIKPRRKNPGREWVYENGKNRIIVDTFIPSDKSDGGLIDYKFFCFNGRVKYLYVIGDRSVGNGAGLAIYDRNYNRLPYLRADERPLKRDIKRPAKYEDMIKCAETLSKPFPHARIDLYNQQGKIIFGEITFFDGSGYMRFNPDEFDEIMGKEFVLPDRNH